jgi:hypothetical protein
MPEAAIREAGRIWSEQVGARDTIEVRARWGATDAGVASSAAPISYVAGFGGAINDSTFYPVALANAMTGEDLNGPDQADIDVLVGSGIPWYYRLTTPCRRAGSLSSRR